MDKPHDYNKEIVDKILKASNIITNKAIFGSGNFIITSSGIGKSLWNLQLNNIRKEKIKEILE